MSGCRKISCTIVRLVPAAQGVSGFRAIYEDSLFILMAIVAVVLLIACANLANFLLARAVARRTGEIGVRIALGASGSGVQWMVLRECLGLLGAGLGLGLPIALYAVRLVRSQLYQMSPFDPAVFVAAIVGIAVVTLVSAWLPARRAASVDPMAALRCE